MRFGITLLNEYPLFGYGPGSFEALFKLEFKNPNSLFANHAHIDLIEFFGEFGLIGSLILIISLKNLYSKKIFLI